MLSNREILLGILLPLIVSLVIGAIGWWKRQSWMLPLAAGAGFLAGYASSLGSSGGFGIPRLPPTDGTDWLFWAALPAIGIAMLAARLERSWPVICGAWAGVVTWTILHPLVPGSLGAAANFEIAIGAAVLGPIAVAVVSLAGERIGHGWTAAAMCIILGGAGVIVLSSNLRTCGVYGLGAGAAAAAAIPFAVRLRATRSLAILAMSLLCGLLACGRFYPDPGVSILHATVLLASPPLVLAGFIVPTTRARLRGVVALLAVGLAVAAIAAPTAMAAKHTAETDPYGASH